MIHPHQYIGDGVQDVNGDDRCIFCYLAESRTDLHAVAEPSPEAVEIDARQMGEMHDEMEG